jgi:DNA polymerase V
VIAIVDGEMLIRRYESNNNRGRLVPASRKISAIDLGESSPNIWGVVTYVIHGV